MVQILGRDRVLDYLGKRPLAYHAELSQFDQAAKMTSVVRLFL